MVRTVKHLQFMSNDFRPRSRLTVLIPALGAKTAFDIDLAAFLQVIAGGIGQFFEKHYPMPFCSLLFAGFGIFPDFTGCQANGDDFAAVIGHVANVRIGAESAQQDDFIYATISHDDFPPVGRARLIKLKPTGAAMGLPRRLIPAEIDTPGRVKNQKSHQA
jgi:hypothetical protein